MYLKTENVIIINNIITCDGMKSLFELTFRLVLNKQCSLKTLSKEQKITINQAYFDKCISSGDYRYKKYYLFPLFKSIKASFSDKHIDLLRTEKDTFHGHCSWYQYYYVDESRYTLHGEQSTDYALKCMRCLPIVDRRSHGDWVYSGFVYKYDRYRDIIKLKSMVVKFNLADMQLMEERRPAKRDMRRLQSILLSLILPVEDDKEHWDLYVEKDVISDHRKIKNTWETYFRRTYI